MFLMPLSTKCFYVIVILVMFWLPVSFSSTGSYSIRLHIKLLKMNTKDGCFFVEIHNKIGKYFLLLVLPLE